DYLLLLRSAVKSFAYPDGADTLTEAGRQQVVHRYVEQLIAQNVSVAAITDYNGVRLEWFASIAERAAAEGITLFPGAEVSFKHGKYGLHVLAICPVVTDLAGLNSFLLSLDRDP